MTDEPTWQARRLAQLRLAMCNRAVNRAGCVRCLIIARLRRGVALARLRRLGVA